MKKNDTKAIKKEQVFNANLKIIKEKYECVFPIMCSKTAHHTPVNKKHNTKSKSCNS